MLLITQPGAEPPACPLRLRPLPYRPDSALAAALLPPPCTHFAPNSRFSASYFAQHQAGI